MCAKPCWGSVTVSEEISRVLADLPESDTGDALREALKRLAVS